MDLELLETFRAVVRAGGMRRAAESLHVSQPAVSGRVRELERQLDTRLFERVGRRLHLTDTGRLLVDESASLLAAADSLRHRVDALRALRAGALRLATIDAVSIHLLPSIYRGFVRRHPRVELRVQVEDSHRVLDLVRELEVELGFFAMPPPTAEPPPEEILAEPFYEDELCAVAAPSHELVGRARLDVATFAAAPLILYSRGSHTRALLDAVFRSQSVVPNVVMEMGSPEAMQRLTEAGVGLAILPRAQVRDALERGRLKRLRPAKTRFVRTLAVARRRDRLLSPAAQRFLDRVRARWPERRGAAHRPRDA